MRQRAQIMSIKTYRVIDNIVTISVAVTVARWAKVETCGNQPSEGKIILIFEFHACKH